MTQRSTPKARLTVAILGATPASLLCIGAIILLLSSADRLSISPLIGSLGMLWGAAGISGAIAAWLFVFGWSERSDRNRLVTIAGIVLGTFSLALLPLVNPASLDGFVIPSLVVPLVAAYYTIYVLLPARKLTGLVFCAMPVVLVLLAIPGIPVASSELVSTRHIVWNCGDYGSCDQYFSYSFVGEDRSHHLLAERGLIDHLRSEPSNEVAAVFTEHFVFGIYTGYELIEIGGYPYRNPNNNTRPLPPGKE